jgi:endonuclease-3
VTMFGESAPQSEMRPNDRRESGVGACQRRMGRVKCGEVGCNVPFATATETVGIRAMAPDTTAPLTPDSPASKRLPAILRRLRQAHPDARCALDHNNPFELLVATILSAQCTDERVNKVTPELFARYPTPAALAEGGRDDVEEIIRSTGFFRQKARYLQGTAHMLTLQFDDQVPPDMDELLKMPGVARKTANVVLGVGFGLAEGIVVDTHVKRLSKRLGLTTQENPNKIEQDLMQLVSRDDWIDVAHLLIFHGRRVCRARKPDCPHCVLNDLCPSAIL